MRILIKAPFLAMASRKFRPLRHIRLADFPPTLQTWWKWLELFCRTVVNGLEIGGMMYQCIAWFLWSWHICTTNIYASVALNVADDFQIILSRRSHHWPSKPVVQQLRGDWLLIFCGCSKNHQLCFFHLPWFSNYSSADALLEWYNSAAGSSEDMCSRRIQVQCSTCVTILLIQEILHKFHN